MFIILGLCGVRIKLFYLMNRYLYFCFWFYYNFFFYFLVCFKVFIKFFFLVLEFFKDNGGVEIIKYIVEIDDG